MKFKGDCVCKKAYDKAYDTKQTLDKAIEPVDWEAGRFFTKKALGEINELITFLDECTLGTSTTVTIADSNTATSEYQPILMAVPMKTKWLFQATIPWSLK